MNIFSSIYNTIRKIDHLLGMTAMAFIVLLACANVFMRYVVGSPWGWVEEVTVFTFVWLSMLGASATVMEEGHISIDVLVRKMSPRKQQIIGLFGDMVVLVTLCLMIWFGIDLTIRGYTKLTPILGIPYSYMNVSMPICGTFMLIYYGKIFVGTLKGEKRMSELDKLIEEGGGE